MAKAIEYLNHQIFYHNDLFLPLELEMVKALYIIIS